MTTKGGMSLSTQMGRAGSLESCDAFITVFKTPEGTTRDIRLESVVLQQFGDQVLETIHRVLDTCNLTSVRVEVRDRGAFEYTLEARLLTALERAGLCKGVSV